MAGQRPTDALSSPRAVCPEQRLQQHHQPAGKKPWPSSSRGAGVRRKKRSEWVCTGYEAASRHKRHVEGMLARGRPASFAACRHEHHAAYRSWPAKGGLAIADAYILASALHACRGDHRQAFTRYQASMMPFPNRTQDGSRVRFAVRTQTNAGISFRNTVTWTFVKSVPGFPSSRFGVGFEVHRFRVRCSGSARRLA